MERYAIEQRVFIVEKYLKNNEIAAGQAVTVTGARYGDMIIQFFLPRLDNIDMANMLFQQDGVTCYTARETLQLLHEIFPGCVLSRSGDQNWPPRSYDLTPLNGKIVLERSKELLDVIIPW